MKAVTCSQCGALVKKISLKENFAFCDFCGAKILLSENQDKIVEISEQEEKPRSPSGPKNISSYSSPDEMFQTPVQGTPLIVGIIIFLGIGLSVAGTFVFLLDGLFSSSPRFGDNTSVKSAPVPTIQSPSPTATPFPPIKYEVKVTWQGTVNDMEHFESPHLEIGKMPTMNEKELKKTVFKVRSVQIKVTINTDGEVPAAEAISGHPVLQEACVKAAKKSLFKPRSKPTNRVLTYYFRLLND